MKSTGEVMGIDRNFAIAFAKSQIGGGSRLPRGGTVFVSVRDADKPRVLDAVRLLVSLGFRIIATSGTQRYLAEQGLPASRINKVLEGRPHIVDAIANGGVQLVFNTTEGATALADSRSLRRAALLHKVPYYTTLSGAVAAAQGIKAYLGGELEDKLARAEVIDVSKLSGDTITFGATVTLVDEDTEKKQVWQLVGEPEADAKKGKISITSPLARALIGKGKGTSVEVMTPSGAKAYEIKKVEWR